MGDNRNRNRFEKIPIDNFRNFIVTDNHSIFLITNNNEVYACGRNDKGQLGLGFGSPKSNPGGGTPIGLGFALVEPNPGGRMPIGLGDSKNRNKFEKISINNVRDVIIDIDSTFIITNNNDIYACGNNVWGQLGLGDNKDRNKFEKIIVW